MPSCSRDGWGRRENLALGTWTGFFFVRAARACLYSICHCNHGATKPSEASKPAGKPTLVFAPLRLRTFAAVAGNAPASAMEAPEEDAEVCQPLHICPRSLTSADSPVASPHLPFTRPTPYSLTPAQFLSLSAPVQGVTLRLSQPFDFDYAARGKAEPGNLLAVSNEFGWVVAARSDGGEFIESQRSLLNSSTKGAPYGASTAVM